MQHFYSPYVFAALSCVFALLAVYWNLRLRRTLAKYARLKKYLHKLKDAERALRKSAFLDPLTGLANRLLLMDRFEVSMRHARRSRKKFAVLMLDLNKFKAINDTYGHAAGDQVLVAVARRLVSIVRESDTVARLGGDEFALIVESITDRTQLEALGQKLTDVVSQNLVLDSGQTVAVGVSIGFAWYPRDGDNLHDVLDVADQAMYTCKASGLMPLSSNGDSQAAGR
jgi:diguanylate cyclase (GGDEF)-like protein